VLRFTKTLPLFCPCNKMLKSQHIGSVHFPAMFSHLPIMADYPYKSTNKDFTLRSLYRNMYQKILPDITPLFVFLFFQICSLKVTLQLFRALKNIGTSSMAGPTSMSIRWSCLWQNLLFPKLL
jgi:hypothetical protein